MDTWRTNIVDAGPTHIRVRGHDVLELMRGATFTDLIFLLHHERLPSAAERRLNAQRAVAALQKSGARLAPVVIEGKGIAHTFWGQAWCRNLERYSDDANRLPRGRS